MPPDDASHPTSVRNRVSLTQVQGQPWLILDFNGATPTDSLAMLDAVTRALEGQSLNSVRLLADLRNVSYDPSVSQKWKAALVKYNPIMRASAVYGASGLAVVATMAAIELMQWLKIPFANRKIRLFTTKEKAQAWLLEC